jgi:microcystin-dependent protein
MTYLSGRTPIYGFPYATPDDDVDVAQEEQAMMIAVENIIQAQTFIIGEIRMFAGAAPAKWLQVLGQILNRTDYPELAAALDTTWNIGGETAAQFRLPPAPGRAIVGAGQNPESGITNRPVATRWGVEAVLLSGAQSGVNGNGVSGADAPDHQHAYPSNPLTDYSGAGNSLWAIPGTTGAPAGNIYKMASNYVGGRTATHTHNLVARGADQSHENQQPSIAMPLYIYAGR